MKKVFVFISILFIMSCDNNADSKQSTAETKPVETKNVNAEKGLELITKSDCFTCHKLTESSIGPAYALIADKYKTLNDVVMDSMVTQIIKGGAGRWGTVPMTPHPDLSKEDAEMMVHYIMSIKK